MLFEYKHIYEKKKKCIWIWILCPFQLTLKVLLSHLNNSTVYFIDEMYKWLGEVWTAAGSKDSCTCACAYASVML